MNQRILLSTALVTALLGAQALCQTTYTVTTTTDSLAAGTLRSALSLVITGDTINFNIPGAGPQTITISPALGCLPPLVAGSVTIDGYTQPGSGPGSRPPQTATPLIELDGSALRAAMLLCHGLFVQSDGNVIRGLIINDFPGDGIRIEGGISGSANNNLVQGCFIGTDPTGTARLGNGSLPPVLNAGVRINAVPSPTGEGIAYFNVVEDCLISANQVEGVWISHPGSGADVGFNTVRRCFIGTDKSGLLPLGNVRCGVVITEGAHDNDVLANLISANGWDGVSITGLALPPNFFRSFNNSVEDNIIGLRDDISLSFPLPNGTNGVAIGIYGGPAVGGSRPGMADSNNVERNLIVANGSDPVAGNWAGVNVFEALSPAPPTNGDFNLISQNSIFGHSRGLGIDLNDDGQDVNDAGDADGGANDTQNFPVIGSVGYNAGVTTVTGSTSPPQAGHVIELFIAVPSNAVEQGEGAWFVGSTTTDAAGNWTIVVEKPVPSDLVTATQTSPVDNTSEFSVNMAVPGTPSFDTMVPSVRFILGRLGLPIAFDLKAGTTHAGQPYVIAGSLSGVTGCPPFIVAGQTIPLCQDAYTNLMLGHLNPPVYVGFTGYLDGQGDATASFNLGATGLAPFLVGNTFHFAYMTTVPPFHVSNPVAVEVVPW